jgi:hypothetical protein
MIQKTRMETMNPPGWGALLRQRRRVWSGDPGSVHGEGGCVDLGMGGCVRSGCDGAQLPRTGLVHGEQG